MTTLAEDRIELGEEIRIDVEQSAAIGDEKVPAHIRPQQMRVRQPRRGGVHVVERAAHVSPSSATGTSRPPTWKRNHFSQPVNKSS